MRVSFRVYPGYCFLLVVSKEVSTGKPNILLGGGPNPEKGPMRPTGRVMSRLVARFDRVALGLADGEVQIWDRTRSVQSREGLRNEAGVGSEWL